MKFYEKKKTCISRGFNFAKIYALRVTKIKKKRYKVIKSTLLPIKCFTDVVL